MYPAAASARISSTGKKIARIDEGRRSVLRGSIAATAGWPSPAAQTVATSKPSPAAATRIARRTPVTGT